MDLVADIVVVVVVVVTELWRLERNKKSRAALSARVMHTGGWDSGIGGRLCAAASTVVVVLGRRMGSGGGRWMQKWCQFSGRVTGGMLGEGTEWPELVLVALVLVIVML